MTEDGKLKTRMSLLRRRFATHNDIIHPRSCVLRLWSFFLFDHPRLIVYNLAMHITYRNKAYETKPNITARDAIKKVGLDPESVLVVVNGKLTTDDVVLREGDEVKLVAVVSGGAKVQGGRGAGENLSSAPLLPRSSASVKNRRTEGRHALP